MAVRILFASTQGAGHFHPLVPFIEAGLRDGHEVLVAGPTALAPVVGPTGYRFWECHDPREEDIRPVWELVQTVSPDEANELVVREIFARFDAAAMLPGLQRAIEAWRPELVLREPYEYASAVAADLYGLASARVAISLGAIEERAVATAAATVSELRRSVGLAEDPDGERIRRSPYLTLFPASFEARGEPEPPRTLRFHDPAAFRPAAPLPDWWRGDEAPLVYVTFGSVVGRMPFGHSVFAAALEAVSDLPVRVLLTVGRETDLAALEPLPANVHAEPWVAQPDALGEATLVVGHGGSGTTLGALAAGRPQVVVPLFADQPDNAAQVRETRSGVVVARDAEAIRLGIETLLGDGSYTVGAERIAAEMRALPPTDSAFDALPGLGPSSGGARSAT